MKTVKFLTVLVAILFSVSSWGQEFMGSKTVTTAGNVDLSEWIVPTGQPSQGYLLKIVVEKADPHLVMTGVNAWTAPSRSFPDNYPDYVALMYAQWTPSSLPGGPYSISGNGMVTYVVSYISDPWVKVDGAAVPGKTHLRDFNDSSQNLILINANSFVELEPSSVFANYYDEVIRLENGIEIESIGLNKAKYPISESGTYRLSTSSGSGCPTENLDFKVVIATTLTPTVTGVSVSPASASVEKGQTKQFTAQVAGTNNPAQTVTWTVEGGTSSSINASGLLSVGSAETANVLTVRATSTADPSKSGTATVTVTAPTGIEDIAMTLPVQQTTVFNLSGNIVLEKAGDIRETDMSPLPAGVYIVQSVLENGRSVFRKMVKR